MTEYLILAACYSEKERHIDWLLVVRHDKQNATFWGDWLAPREFVYDLIATGSASFSTLVYHPDSKRFEKGASVHMVGNGFLTTDPDFSEANNLGNLPEFAMPAGEIDAELKKITEKLFPGVTRITE